MQEIIYITTDHLMCVYTCVCVCIGMYIYRCLYVLWSSPLKNYLWYVVDNQQQCAREKTSPVQR